MTAPYHDRDARGLGLPVHAPPADTWLGIQMGGRKHLTRDEVAARLCPLLDLPIELPAHSEPVGREALERALI